VIASVHLAESGPRRGLRAYFRAPDPAVVPGLTYAETVVTAPLSSALLPKPSIGKVGLIASWQDDEHLDRFLADPILAGPGRRHSRHQRAEAAGGVAGVSARGAGG
jgi:hypothetical protein